MDFQSPSTLKPHVYKGFPFYIYILHNLINMDFQGRSTLKPHVYQGFPLYIYIVRSLHPISTYLFARGKWLRLEIGRVPLLTSR